MDLMDKTLKEYIVFWDFRGSVHSKCDQCDFFQWQKTVFGIKNRVEEDSEGKKLLFMLRFVLIMY